jgi:hypothetical protein
MTLLKAFKREGISQEGQATMSKFKGSDLNPKNELGNNAG